MPLSVSTLLAIRVAFSELLEVSPSSSPGSGSLSISLNLSNLSAFLLCLHLTSLSIYTSFSRSISRFTCNLQLARPVRLIRQGHVTEVAVPVRNVGRPHQLAWIGKPVARVRDADTALPVPRICIDLKVERLKRLVHRDCVTGVLARSVKGCGKRAALVDLDA